MKYRSVKLYFFLLFFLNSPYLMAQFVNFGQDRASLHWKQINTEDFQIIFHDFFEADAQKMANIYSLLYKHANTMGIKARKIAVIVHSDGGISNGNATLVPRKIELYTRPTQNPGDSWLEHLCVHEFRHIVQLDKVNCGLTKGLSRLFGELFPIVVVGVYVPMWFMEGDAVCFETSVGNLGRGRSPEFLDEMKAQVTEKGIYSFSKAVLGSCKDFVPDRYVMGYFMTANARVNYGSDIWSKALERAGRQPFGITSFAKSLKLTMKGRRDSLWQNPHFHSLFTNPDSIRRTNTHRDAKHTLYLDNFTELRALWREEMTGRKNDFDTIPTENRYYTRYYYPVPDDNGKVIAYKDGLQQTGAFVSLSAEGEKLLTRTGTLYDNKFAFNGRQIVWSEYFPHLRWEQGGRMRLSSYDLRTGKYRRHRGQTNQSSPFPVDNQWGFVETNNRNEDFLIVADSTFSREIIRIPAAPGESFIHPSYANGKILTVVQSSEGLHLEQIALPDGKRECLTDNFFYELDNPVYADSSIIYRASFNGHNAFYRLKDKQTSRILEGRYGLRFPYYQADSGQLFFSFYTADGYKPARIGYDSLRNQPVEYTHFGLADSMKRQEKWQFSFTADSIYPVRKYNKFTHLANIHSWAPIYIDLYDPDVNIGAVVYSQNKLSTLSFSAGYILESGYNHGAWMFNATYSGLWPVIALNLKCGRENGYTVTGANEKSSGVTENLYIYNRSYRSSADITAQLPFNISKRQYIRSISPYVRYKLEALHAQKVRDSYSYMKKDSVIYLIPVDIHNYDFHQSSRFYQIMEYGIRFSNQTRMTVQEINPRWGQIVSAGFTQCLNQGIDLGNQWWCDGRLYFPGLAANHSISVYGGFQTMSGQTRNYGNKILYPRGIGLHGYEISSIRSSYCMPLLFPDLHIGGLIYFKNVCCNLFYDYGTSRDKIQTLHYNSYGMEMTADTHVFRLTYPIHLGFRTGYETKKKSMFADFIFSIGLSI